jgi:lipopolysaccharide transport system ATP-binding protein
MNDLAIQVEDLGKRYRIGGPRESYGTFRDSLIAAASAPLRALRGRGWGGQSRQFWALRDLSFEVRQGEALGIIGRNGAGKSTLLKILSRVTRPTTGRARIHGRVGSLLEVGTGFHPELSGRENIYLNGAVLGLKRAEIHKKFDAIVDFAGVEEFLETPVKRYSSGMYMRLAFSIAAHLEPEVLIVDEVLAVGDAAFQKKCLGKMEDVAGEGRTVLFVSHNMPAVTSLCRRAIHLSGGQLVDEGPPATVVQRYLESEIALSSIPLAERQDRSGDGSARIISLRIESTEPDGIIRSTSRLRATIGYRSDQALHRPQFLINIHDQSGMGLFLLGNAFVGGLPATLPPEGEVTCVTAPINLTAGRCLLHVELLKGNDRADMVPYAGFFDVEADDFYGTGMMPPREWVMSVIHQEWSPSGGQPQR